MSEKIFFVEDDESIFELINATLSVAGFETKGFREPLSFLEHIKNEQPDLIILDLMLPHLDGYEVLKKITCQPIIREIPVIILSAKSAELDKVKGLDLGASDYITKPFGVLEFLSRVRVNLRKGRRQLFDTECLEFGNLKINNLDFSFYVDSKKVDLTVMEFEIIRFLMEMANTVITRAQFLSVIWGYTEEVESRALDMHINKLRNKIKEHTDQVHIETVRGVGYILKMR